MVSFGGSECELGPGLGRREKGPLWVILAPGPGDNGGGQFLGGGASMAPGATVVSGGQAAARSAGDG